MKITIDTDKNILTYEENGKIYESELYSKKSFEIISKQWVKVGWNQKYSYTFSWMGRPIIQLPEDMVRIQEVIYQLKPDVIIETGVAHGGSLIFYASLCKALGKGRIIGIDIEILLHNRKAIENHEMSSFITLIEGNSLAESVIKQVESLLKPDDKVLVILDSCHTKQHVLEELEAYSKFVSVGSYIVATDGIMKDLYDVPRGVEDWKENNPTMAALQFVEENLEYSLEKPEWMFNESDLNVNITHWPGAWIKKIS